MPVIYNLEFEDSLGTNQFEVRPFTGQPMDYRKYEEVMDLADSDRSVIIVPWDYVSPAEVTFRIQRDAFLKIPPLIKQQYRGEYIISKDGAIVDHDSDIDRLTERFFGNQRPVDVFITLINGETEAALDTPFFD